MFDVDAINAVADEDMEAYLLDTDSEGSDSDDTFHLLTDSSHEFPDFSFIKVTSMSNLCKIFKAFVE